jgi:phage terminase small subunit
MAKSKQRDDRRSRFAQEYAKDLNGTQAAIRAGYAPKAAHVTSSRLLKDAKVNAEIAALLKKVATKNEITVERTLQEIARIAYGDIRKLYREDGSLKALHEMDEDAAAQLAGVDVEEEYHSKVEVEGEGDEAEAKITPAVTITRKVKRWDKVKALDQCMAYLGMHKTANPAEGGSLSLTINLSGGKRVR